MKEFEIICVNDGSSDKSVEILNRYANIDGRIKVVHQQNGGLSSARNEGLKYVKGDYFMFVDSDDWISLDTCELAYYAATRNDYDCVMFTYTKEFDNKSIVCHTFDYEFSLNNQVEVREKILRRLFGPMDWELSKPQNLDLIVSAWGQIFKTSKFQSIEFVDTKKIGTEDCLYQIEVYTHCNSFVYIDSPLYHYRKTNNSSLTSIYKKELFDRWQNLYNIMYEHIEKYKLPNIYKIALNNRIAFSVLGIGLNQIHSKENCVKGGKRLSEMLKTSRYEYALQNLDTKPMPFEWKIFFFLAKNRITISLFLMLELIEYIRLHKQ